METNLYEISYKEDVQFVKDFIEFYGISEEIYLSKNILKKLQTFDNRTYIW